MTDKSYAQKAVEAVRGIPNNARWVYLWEFPESDLAAHQPFAEKFTDEWQETRE